MSRMDKAEDYVFKLSREYQDTWTKYAEALERGENSVKVRVYYVRCEVCVGSACV